MSNQESLKLGHIITTPQERDAVHVAIAPVVCCQRLRPGQRTGLDAMGRACDRLPHIGIIDPFLLGDALEGQQCWLWLFPGTITSLRHDWTHPTFDKLEES